jgi:hypothetical protein
MLWQGDKRIELAKERDAAIDATPAGSDGGRLNDAA